MADASAADFSDLNPALHRGSPTAAASTRQGIKYSLRLWLPRRSNQAADAAANRDAEREATDPSANAETATRRRAAWRSIRINYGLRPIVRMTIRPLRPIRALAPQFGLSGDRSSDPGHIKLRRALDAGINAVKLAEWRPRSIARCRKLMSPPTGEPPQPRHLAVGWAPIATQQSGNETHEQFIRDYASKIGVNPDLAVGIANAEGIRAWSEDEPERGVLCRSHQRRAVDVWRLPAEHPQRHGNDARKAGIDPRDPNQWQAADRYAHRHQ